MANKRDKQEIGSPDPEVETLLANLDGTFPEVAPILAKAERGLRREAALDFVAFLRRRRTPRPEWSRARIRRLRIQAGEKARRAARERFERAWLAPPVGARLLTLRSHLSDTDLILGAPPDLGERLAARLGRDRERWGKGGWGTTLNIVELLRRMLCLPECRDDALLPPLAWLIAQLPAEWSWARTWSEAVLGHSGHNWWLHTFLGFFKAGLYFPQIRGFARFRSLGSAFFEREALLLLERDGFTRERSGYHYGTAAQFFEFRDLADEFGFRLSDAFHARLQAAAEAEWKVRTPTGDLPHWGDGFAGYASLEPALADSSRGGRPGRAPLCRALRLAAARFALPEAKFVAEALHPDDPPAVSGGLWLDGRDWAPAYAKLKAAPPPLPDTALPETGYYFMRQDWTPHSDWLGIEAGPTGSIVTSHDHVDLFALELYSRGRPVLLDNGAGPYGDSPERVWRLGGASHNTVTVDGQDPVPLRNEWRRKGSTTPVVDSWISRPSFAYFSGGHEGYLHLPEPVASVRRKVFYLRGLYWIVLDRFVPETEAEHVYTLHFHVPDPSRLMGNGRLVTSGKNGRLLVAPVPGLSGEAALEPCPHPLEGYANPMHLTYSRRGRGPQLFATLLVPFMNGERPAVSVQGKTVECDGRQLEPWEATGLVIRHNDRQDVYFDQHMAWNLPWRLAGQAGETRLFHSAVDLTG